MTKIRTVYNPSDPRPDVDLINRLLFQEPGITPFERLMSAFAWCCAWSDVGGQYWRGSEHLASISDYYSVPSDDLRSMLLAHYGENLE